MDADWIKSRAARTVLGHWADARPAWLWSADGQRLIWRNRAARLMARALAPHPGQDIQVLPMRGQVARLARLGVANWQSRSQVRLAVGEHPLSLPCLVELVSLGGGEIGVLLVGVEPLDLPLESPSDPDALETSLLPRGWEVWSGADSPPGNAVQFGNAAQLLILAPSAPPAPDPAPVEPDPAVLPIAPAADPVLEAAPADESAALSLDPEVPALFDSIAADAAASAPADSPERARAPGDIEAPESDETEVSPAEPEVPSEPAATEGKSDSFAAPPAPMVTDLEADERALAADTAREEAEDAGSPPPQTPPAAPPLFRVTGRGFTPGNDQPAPTDDNEPAAAGDEDQPEPPESSDRETVERVSRYNFDELSRILADRIGLEPSEVRAGGSPPQRPREGELINLTGDTFVLNRLPLGILVFRDQQILFANRALCDLTAYESSERLRAQGLAAIFPTADTPGANAGPVTHLLRSDGQPVAVTARLQSISWQGRPALMLSASLAETAGGHEAAVRGFAHVLARVRDEGFIELNRSGTIEAVSDHTAVVLGRTAEELIGEPVSVLVNLGDIGDLQTFLEMPARFAETERPSLLVKGAEAGYDLTLFAKGQAGIVSGYLVFVRRLTSSGTPVAVPTPGEGDLALLGRLSRDLRRPLNTILGFSELMRTPANSPTEAQRHIEYARDIHSAGSDISVLVDELDEFARLRDGRYAARPADFDLGQLLEACVLRVRGQAGLSRVLVRSAISERLPRIRADRASLSQAVLNLLASAIAQTPAGSAVVLSAQWEDDGAIAVHVRDASRPNIDPAERFVVFRDGHGRDGETLGPVRSTVGLALTRSLLAVNACSLSVDPTSGTGTLFSLLIPRDLVVETPPPNPGGTR